MADARDPVPGAVRAAAHAALDWRTLDAELATLVADTAARDEDLALVRSGTQEVLLASPPATSRWSSRSAPRPGGGSWPAAAAAAARRDHARAPRRRAARARGGRPRSLRRRRARAGPARLGIRVDAATGARRVATPWTML